MLGFSFLHRKSLVTTGRYKLIYGSRKKEHLEVEVYKVHETIVDDKQ